MPKELTLGASSESKQDDLTTKKPLHTDQTTYPSVSSKNISPRSCDCLGKDKRDAFFEKLICYLEKQSEVISKFCLDGRSSVENKRINTDPIFPKETSPCIDQEDDSLQVSKHKGAKVDVRDQKTDKKSDCKIYVEVCTCNKNTKVVKGSASNRSVSRREKSSLCEEVVMSNIQRNVSSRHVRNDDSCCERKVDSFYKLAEEICQGYLRQCNASEGLNQSQSQASRKRGRLDEEDPCDSPPGRSYREECGRNDEHMPEHGLCRNITMEVDCHGTKQEYVIQPCDCPPERGCVTPPSKNCPRSCLDMFEDKYGTLLKQVHAMLCENQQQGNHPSKADQPSGDHRQPFNQQQHSPQQSYQPPGRTHRHNRYPQQEPAGYPQGMPPSGNAPPPPPGSGYPPTSPGNAPQPPPGSGYPPPPPGSGYPPPPPGSGYPPPPPNQNPYYYPAQPLPPEYYQQQPQPPPAQPPHHEKSREHTPSTKEKKKKKKK